jgi:hypothetical protein
MIGSVMDYSKDRIVAVQAILSSIFASQKALKALAPDYKWAGLGNLLGDFGELVATDFYGLKRAASGSGDYDAETKDGKKVQIKTNYAANQIGFRGQADLLLAIHVKEDGTWEEIYYGDFKAVLDQARRSERDNKNMIAVTKLRKMNNAKKDPKKNRYG